MRSWMDWGEGDHDGYDITYLHGKAIYPRQLEELGDAK